MNESTILEKLRVILANEPGLFFNEIASRIEGNHAEKSINSGLSRLREFEEVRTVRYGVRFKYYLADAKADKPDIIGKAWVGWHAPNHSPTWR